jgi:hypothetical protein
MSSAKMRAMVLLPKYRNFCCAILGGAGGRVQAAGRTAANFAARPLHRVRKRLVSQCTGIINQIRAFLLERGVAIRQGLRFLRAELPRILY